MRRLVILFALVLTACPSGGDPGGDISVARSRNIVTFSTDRTLAPPVEGEMLAGDPVDVAGSVAVVNFWGSWCGPCRQEQPHLEAAWKRFGPDGVVFVGVNSRRDQRAAALAFLDEFDVTYPSIYDPTSALAAAFGLRFMPATYVLDRNGGIAAIVTGALGSDGALVDILKAELKA